MYQERERDVSVKQQPRDRDLSSQVTMPKDRSVTETFVLLIPDSELLQISDVQKHTAPCHSSVKGYM